MKPLQRRSTLRTYFVEPFLQIRFGLHVVAVSFLFVLLLGGLFTRAFYQQYEHVMTIFGVADMSDRMDLVVNEVFIKNAILIGLCLFAMVATTIAVVVVRTHKMYGPMVGFIRVLGELKRGNYAARLHVRRKDDFQGLARALNELAETLHRNHGVPAGPTQTGTDLDALAQRVDQLNNGIVNVSTPPSEPQESEENHTPSKKAS